ncbi:hypothetical protein BD560DRAFT_422853 [Blakeslea trispora]|nr:hypothetical protein BD560DRAFT_422853 [Blakeslea trispora]
MIDFVIPSCMFNTTTTYLTKKLPDFETLGPHIIEQSRDFYFKLTAHILLTGVTNTSTDKRKQPIEVEYNLPHLYNPNKRNIEQKKKEDQTKLVTYKEVAFSESQLVITFVKT